MFKHHLLALRSSRVAARAPYLGLSLAIGLLSAAALLAGGRSAQAAPPVRPLFSNLITVTTTIQAAIDSASSGDTIIVPVGRYTESLTLNKDVSLIGVLSSTTIVRAISGQRVLTVTGAAINATTVISGLTFTGGDMTGDGGAISVEGNAEPQLVNLIVISNTASNTAGGVYGATGSPLHLVNVMVISNTSQLYGGGAFALGGMTVQGGRFQGNYCAAANCQGGGLAMANGLPLALADVQFISNTSDSSGAGAEVLGDLTLQGGLFQGNSCANGCAGGGLRVHGALVLSGTQFIGNKAIISGGGVEALGAATVQDAQFQGNQCTGTDCLGGGLTGYGALSLVNTQFINNMAVGYGGGAAVLGAAAVQGGLFQDNTALGTIYGGGGLLAANMFVLTGTQFIANHAPNGGGGLWQVLAGSGQVVNALFAANTANARGAALVWNSPGAVVILHTTIVSPAVSGSASAIAVLSGTLSITDSVIASYTVGISHAAGTVTEDYNLFSGVALTSTSALVSGGHSHTGNPAFRNPAAGDYHLAFGSAAIDAGIAAGESTDFEGDPRPIGAGVDIGFDEARLVALVLSKTDGQVNSVPGAVLTYTIIVNNTGPYPAAGVVVSDSLPSSLTGAAWSCLASAGSSCPAGGNGSIHASVTVANGSFVQFTLHATVALIANGPLVNTVSAGAPAALVNTNAANNTASDTTTIQGGLPLKVYLPVVLH